MEINLRAKKYKKCKPAFSFEGFPYSINKKHHIVGHDNYYYVVNPLINPHLRISPTHLKIFYSVYSPISNYRGVSNKRGGLENLGIFFEFF